MKGGSVVAGEERVVGIPKFYSWDKCTMNINSDWMSNASSGLCIIIILFTWVLYVASWGVALQDTGMYNSDSALQDSITRYWNVQL